jgi:hypothetical protein
MDWFHWLRNRGELSVMGTDNSAFSVQITTGGAAFAAPPVFFGTSIVCHV